MKLNTASKNCGFIKSMTCKITYLKTDPRKALYNLTLMNETKSNRFPHAKLIH